MFDVEDSATAPQEYDDAEGGSGSDSSEFEWHTTDTEEEDLSDI